MGEKLSPVLLDMRLGMPPPKGDEKNDDTVDKWEKGREGITSISLDATSRVSYSNGQCNTRNCGGGFKLTCSFLLECISQSSFSPCTVSPSVSNGLNRLSQ